MTLTTNQKTTYQINDIFETIKSKVTILDLIKYFNIPITNSGHIKSIYNQDDKTPSMYVRSNDNNSRFKDFSTGQSGDIFDFYQDYQNVQLEQSIKEINQIFNCGLDINNHILDNNQEYQFKKRKIFIQKINKKSMETTKKENNKDLNFKIYDHLELKCRKRFLNKEQYESLLNLDRFEKVKYYQKIQKDEKRLLMSENAQKYLFDRAFDFNTIVSSGMFYLYNLDLHEVMAGLKKHFTQEELIQSGLFKLIQDEKTKESILYFSFQNNRLFLPYLDFQNNIEYLQANDFESSKESNKFFKKYKFLNGNVTKKAYNLSVYLEHFKNLNSKFGKLNELSIFLVEGYFDALSLIQNNCYSISCTNNEDLNVISDIDLLELSKTGVNLVLAFDNDNGGDIGRQKWGNKLNNLRIKYTISKPPVEYKDWNEYLVFKK